MKTKLAFSVLALTALCGASAFAPRTSAQDATPAPTTPAQAAPATQTKPEDLPPYFPDVPRNHWAYDAVQRLAAAGIIVGRPVPTRKAAPQTDTVFRFVAPQIKTAFLANRALRSIENLNIDTSDRTVTLKGLAQSRNQVHLAAQVAQKIAPGYKIVNQIHVIPAH